MPAAFTIDVTPHTLRFIKPAGTSRGIMTTRKVWYICLTSTSIPYRQGWGECAPLPNLSVDDRPDYDALLRSFCQRFEKEKCIDWDALRPYPSLYVGFETAWSNYEGGGKIYKGTPFSKELSGIPINGLVWMGSYESMAQQVDNLLSRGFTCVKLKIGSLRFEDEWSLVRSIRKRFPASQVQLRVDANGAYTPTQAGEYLQRLAELDIHSIEQPIKAGQWSDMAALAASSPLPIALDEELIGIHDPQIRALLLDTIKPAFLVLKPSLHGGFEGCQAWIRMAEERQIGWWVTSALESNVGLSAIAHWCATLGNSLHQGLGTGSLYENNTETDLFIKGERLFVKPSDQEQTIPAQTGFLLNGHRYDWDSLQTAYPSDTCPKCQEMDALMAFLADWFHSSPTLNIYTSGTTGAPSRLIVQKSRMIYSARQTLRRFNLKPGDDCLLCLPLDFIAAKMMVVRALVGGLNLWIKLADGHPFKATNQSFRFVPLVPLQLFNSLQDPSERAALERCETILIGGAPLSPELEQATQALNTPVIVSYGMAETLSHIALRRANGPEASNWYSPLPGIHVSLNPEGCLKVEAPMLCQRPVQTHDVAEIDATGRFRILGRLDNLINTGGKKILAETLESLLASYIRQPFAVTSQPDAKLSHRVVLVTEGPFDRSVLSTFKPAWMKPKAYVVVNSLPRTISGKLDRNALHQLVNASGTH